MKVLVDKAALDDLLRSAVPAYEGGKQAIAEELHLEALIDEAVSAAQPRRRARSGDSNIDPLDQLVQVAIGVPELMNRFIKSQVAEADTNVQVYIRATLHLAMRAGLMERVTEAMRSHDVTAGGTEQGGAR
ncbi:hypothetical protein [Burkholderia cenocepacia]|uniref:hypothetical protein n=1 Tax=Burkholderia cenocepacia TaxID=95486 RepID=UPI001B9D58AF|nr:hypothetical protein [Burkholderia cenocepacia]MBR8427289.1 hypothetical protein [Burkholderia cenocepacia]